MSVPAEKMKAISIPTTQIEGQSIGRLPSPLSVSADDKRVLLIETIRQNVMTWTQWARESNIKLNQ